MDRDEAQAWVSFVGALEKAQNGDETLRAAVLQRFGLQVGLMAVWLNTLLVTGGKPIIAAGAPEGCDLCDATLGDNGFMIDGAIKSGGWANMCMPCYAKHGKGVGWGVGQLYRMSGRDDDGDPRWVCIAGGPPARPQDDEED